MQVEWLSSRQAGRQAVLYNFPPLFSKQCHLITLGCTIGTQLPYLVIIGIGTTSVFTDDIKLCHNTLTYMYNNYFKDCEGVTTTGRSRHRGRELSKY